jgi:hypothetical protein
LLWGYLASTSPSKTALIPVGFGIIFALAKPLLRKENKVIAHVLVLLTVILALALVVPLRGAINRDDFIAALRIGATNVTLLCIGTYDPDSRFGSISRAAKQRRALQLFSKVICR